MPESLATALVLVLAVYAGIGVPFAVVFVLLGVQRIDPAARGATRGFRMMILPGSVALWPLLLLRWVRGSR